jgi:transposase
VVSPQASSPIEIAFPCCATVRVHHDADMRLLQHVAAGLLGVAWCFVFRNRRGTQFKILYWVRDRWAIWHRRPEQGTFRALQASDDQASLSISSAELAMLIEGIDASEVHRKQRFRMSGKIDEFLVLYARINPLPETGLKRSCRSTMGLPSERFGRLRSVATT